MLKEFSSREAAGNLSGRDKQVPAVKDCRFTQTAFGTVVHDSSGKWLGQYETDANTLLAIECTPDSLDSRLKQLPADKQDYLKKTFDFMIEQALKSA